MHVIILGHVKSMKNVNCMVLPPSVPSQVMLDSCDFSFLTFAAKLIHNFNICWHILIKITLIGQKTYLLMTNYVEF